SGPFDRLDWAFYWGDAVAFALLPPLLLHFTLVFPERPLTRAIRESALVPLIYAPAFVLAGARVITIARGADGSLAGPAFTRGLGYAAFLGASGAIYAGLVKFTAFVLKNDVDQHNWIVALLGTLVIVLLARPVKDAVQDALDRAFYRDRYDYRRALVAFARDL